MPTMLDKIWDSHVVCETPTGPLLYIDRHVCHEVTTPQAFEGLALAGRRVRRLESTVAVPDHNVPTKNRANNPDPLSVMQLEALEKNVAAFNVPYIPLDDIRQGIVHVIGPELGFTQPGLTMVCGDSHTSTNGAFGALGFGIGTSQVEHVLATNTLIMPKPKALRVTVTGTLSPHCSGKDVALAIIEKIGTAGGTGYVIEYAGPVIEALSMEGRMSLANMSIEAGARAGLVAPDQKTFDYLEGRPYCPTGEDWDRAVALWSSLKSDDDAVFDKEVVIDGSEISPLVTWGTSPEQVASVASIVPQPTDLPASRQAGAEQALGYMDLTAGMAIQDIAIDRVFIGSCTNSRIEDMRAAAKVLKGRKVSDRLKEAIIVPGSGLVKAQAEQEGLHEIFTDSGFEWREPGCSMCLAMNPDKADPGDRVASTSNRNFEGRQGPGARTHLMSPAMAAAAAVAGHIADVRDFEGEA